MRILSLLLLASLLAAADATSAAPVLDRVAMIKGGVIIDIAVWDGVSAWAPPVDVLVDLSTGVDLTHHVAVTIPAGVDIGWTFANGAFTAPAPVGP